MALFHRRQAPPDVAVSRLPKDERVLSWADAASGAVLIATPRGLWWPDGDAVRLIGWQYVDKAVWRDDRLTVIEAEVVDELLLVDRAPVSVELTTPRDLPVVVRKRVEANVVRSELRSVDGGVARFVARRIPGRDGVVWWVRLEGGVADTAQLRALLAAERDVLREQWRDGRD
jgi:hypothetical protein